MKPQLIAKRNAEMRRKEKADELASTEVDIEQSIASGAGERAREAVITVTQAIGGILLMVLGVFCFLPIYFLIRCFFTGVIFIVIVFLGIFAIPIAIFGVTLIRLGFGMLRSNTPQQREAPVLRALQQLSYDAVPVMAYVVGKGKVTNQVLICFEGDVNERRMMSDLAEKLSDPEILADLTGGEVFVPDRRLRVPRDLAEGRVVYLADLQMKHVVVGGVTRVRRSIACVAEAGAGGRIAVSG